MISSVMSQFSNEIFYFFGMLYYTFMPRGPHTLARPLYGTGRLSWIIPQRDLGLHHFAHLSAWEPAASVAARAAAARLSVASRRRGAQPGCFSFPLAPPNRQPAVKGTPTRSARSVFGGAHPGPA